MVMIQSIIYGTWRHNEALIRTDCNNALKGWLLIQLDCWIDPMSSMTSSVNVIRCWPVLDSYSIQPIGWTWLRLSVSLRALPASVVCYQQLSWLPIELIGTDWFVIIDQIGCAAGWSAASPQQRRWRSARVLDISGASADCIELAGHSPALFLLALMECKLRQLQAFALGPPPATNTKKTSGRWKRWMEAADGRWWHMVVVGVGRRGARK